MCHTNETIKIFIFMQNIYTDSIKQISQGSRFHINFQKRNLKINGHYIIKEGEYEGDLGFNLTSEPLSEITHLFSRYLHSIPSERSESKKHRYFYALPEHKLSDEDMLYGEPRELAQFKLELYILMLILTNSLNWNDIAKDKWFWQSPEEKDLIILKEWVEPKIENNN